MLFAILLVGLHLVLMCTQYSIKEEFDIKNITGLIIHLSTVMTEGDLLSGHLAPGPFKT